MNKKKLTDKLHKGKSTASEQLPSVHDIFEESFPDFNANITWEEIDPVVYDAPIFEENV